MAKPKLKRTLYIGLGGTGFKTLVHTKKAFIETYGEVPPMIKFLAFDSDQNQGEYSLPSSYGDIALDPSEMPSLSVVEAKPWVIRNRTDLTWLPDENIRAVEDLVNGCGMVRTNGRIAFAFNYQNSDDKIQKAIQDICNLANIHSDKYDLLGSDVEVNLVFSIAGGTGAGTFIDMAYLVKNIFKKKALPETSKIIGYMVLGDVYDAQLTFGKARIIPNTCGSLIDLDYFSHLDFNKQIEVNYIKEYSQLEGSPFNAIFAISNSNQNGDVVTDSENLSQMMSLAMVVSAGELSSRIRSVANNLERDTISGDFDIPKRKSNIKSGSEHQQKSRLERKRAIMSTLGMSEITFRASELKQLYTVKVAREIASLLLNPGQNADIDANNWINEQKIRENYGKDDVIDYLLDKQPKVVLMGIDDEANPRTDVDNYCAQNNVAVSQQDLNNKIQSLEDRIKPALDKKLVDIVNSVGPAYAQDFVGQVKNQINLCLVEMREELNNFSSAVAAKESSITTSIQEYKTACKKIFNRSQAKTDAKETLCAAVKNKVINDREIHRRNGAITFYTWLLAELDRIETKLNNIQDNIRSACALISKEISSTTNRLNAPRGLFEIDLTLPYINQVTVNPKEIVLNQFIQSLPNDSKVNTFDGLQPKEIANLMVTYASTLESKANWEKMTVEDALAKMPKKEAENLVRKAIKLASPMCALNFRGHDNQTPNNYYYIGVQEQSTTKLNGNILSINDCIDASGKFETIFSSIGSKDRIVIYHQYGVFPTFAIAGTHSYRNAYNNYDVYSCHIDEDLRIKMEREGFSVVPKEPIDVSMELWVKGLIFGLITRDVDGIYYYMDESNDDAALDNYKTSLGTKYRDEAFSNFKQQAERLLPQYEEIMRARTEKEGSDSIDNILRDAKQNYKDKYSLNEFSNNDLNNSLYEKIKQQILDELKFVKENL